MTSADPPLPDPLFPLPDAAARAAASADAATAAPTAVDLLADAGWLESLRRQMQRFARLQLGDDGAADDAVQDALLGALGGAKRFGGRSAVRTWVFAILKNKIADQLRLRGRSINTSSLLAEDDDEPRELDEMFDARGHWTPAATPRAWGDPEASLDNRQFWVVFVVCLDGLPPRLGRVFMMRELVELDSDEICAAVGITASNLFVMLHRARARLRECLATRWYTDGQPC